MRFAIERVGRGLWQIREMETGWTDGVRRDQAEARREVERKTQEAREIRAFLSQHGRETYG